MPKQKIIPIKIKMLYELMVVARVASAEATLGKVEKLIKESASNLRISKLGKKNLAYKISGEAEGEYFVFNFEAEGERVNNISQKLRLEQEAILRHLIIARKKKEVEVKIETVAASEETEKPQRPKVTVKTVTKKIKEADRSKQPKEPKIKKPQAKKTSSKRKK